MVGYDPVFSVSDAVAVLNQTLEMAYPTIMVVGELSDLRVSRDKWLYFDIKDDGAKLKCFGTVWQIKTPLEDGMQVAVTAAPRLHPLYGLSLNLQSVRPVGEGSIKKSADLLRAKLESEGLFAAERKRRVLYGPSRIGLITAEQSAAYIDFIKILNARWQGVEVEVFNVAVQGVDAPEAIIEAVSYFNQKSDVPEVLVIIRGGGSVDDLQAFNMEPVVRAVAGSRIPTLAAIGHEKDVSLAELAADLRASTPSNAAELLFPDKFEFKKKLTLQLSGLDNLVRQELRRRQEALSYKSGRLAEQLGVWLDARQDRLEQTDKLLENLHPRAGLRRGFALVRTDGKLVRSAKSLRAKQKLNIMFNDGEVEAKVE